MLLKTEEYIGYQFESSSRTTPEFRRFIRAYRADVKSLLRPYDILLVDFAGGHFDGSGFARRDEKYIYFSFSDVRFFPEAWRTAVLYRTAKHTSDYTGGVNHDTPLRELGEAMDRLFNELTSA